jgi:hypothetical protein
MSTLKLAKDPRVDATTLFQSSLCQDGEWLKEIAINLGVDPDAFQAIAVLMPVPFLQACSRRWTRSIIESWMEGYCPVCGAWPAFTEALSAAATCAAAAVAPSGKRTVCLARFAP